MAVYEKSTDEDLSVIGRLMNHHDHFKTLNDFYGEELNRLSLEKMRRFEYYPNLSKMKQNDESYFTSLIIKLSDYEGNPVFDQIRNAYEHVTQIVRRHYPDVHTETYLDAAHITIKSIVNFQQQTLANLEVYKAILANPVQRWIECFSADTMIYLKGFFVSISSNKGLSIGVRAFPSTTLIQTLRGVAGVELYNALDRKEIMEEMLWPETDFYKHTLLTHSTGLRIRDSLFVPAGPFIDDLEQLIVSYQDHIFGRISALTLGDFYVRNGKSDKLMVGAEGGIELTLK